MISLLTKKLPKGKVAWCVGIPYTKEQFFSCCHKEEKSDFIESLEFLYGTTVDEILWNYYKPIANNITKTIKELKNRNVTIIPISNKEDFVSAFSHSIIILTAHHHRYLSCIELLDNPIFYDEMVDCIPSDFAGYIDISSCFSTSIQPKVKIQAPDTTIIAANTEISIELRMFLYRHIISYMTLHPNDSYKDAFTIISLRFKQTIKENESKHKEVFLGGKSVSEKGGECASAFAPKRVLRGEDMMIQVYVYNDIDRKGALIEAKKADSNTVERNYVPLDFKIKNGDTINIQLNLLHLPKESQKKSFVWHNKISKATFFVSVPKEFEKNQIYAEILIFANRIPVGELDFCTQIVNKKSEIENAKFISRQFNKVFISYAHQDEEKVKSFHEGLKLLGVEHFFDRDYLKAGDVFPQVIRDYINSTDLFVLFWSENALKSEYVEKERTQALGLAFPQVEPQQAAKLSIYPMSIEPRAELPSDMKGIYHFGEL
ncbi:MAG: toll/interleukin-1 receptor domain-containing protein [Bacteroidales bacterium]|nr:toll/interleukin-1 receptor domain-containing protein [Bacteroidales bacterium]